MPDSGIDEIDDVPEPEPVDEVPDGPSQEEPEGDAEPHVMA